jgi:phage protein D
MLARRTAMDLMYQGVNVSASIAKDLLSFTYTDNASDISDSISISLKDDTGKWITAWAPGLGDKIKASILTTNWWKDGESQKLDCGTFMVDDPEYSGRPRILTLNAAALPSNNDFRDTDKSKTWEKITVRKIANDIAYSAGLALYYDTAKSYTISYIEQSEQPDSAFLADICSKYGLCLKVYNDKIVIFSEVEYEAKPKIWTITEDKALSWNAKKTLTETGYDACVLTYTPPSSGQKLQYAFNLVPSPKKILRINHDVANVAEAEIVAKAELRKANIKQYTMSFSTLGNVYLIASYPVMVSGFGVFDGKYYIDKVDHTVGSGYTSSIDVHRVLVGGY